MQPKRKPSTWFDRRALQFVDNQWQAAASPPPNGRIFMPPPEGKVLIGKELEK